MIYANAIYVYCKTKLKYYKNERNILKALKILDAFYTHSNI